MLKLALAVTVPVALASKPPILYYAPSSGVTDHARIDLDQKALETAVGLAGAGTGTWVPVMDVYSKGAHSKPKSKCDIVGPCPAGNCAGVTTLANNIDAASKNAVAATEGDGTATPPIASVQRTVSIDSAVTAGAGAKIVFKYTVSGERVEPAASACYRGGLPTSAHVTAGCIKDGTVTITPVGGAAAVYGISNCAQEQAAGRTLQGFSTKARKYMLDSKADAATNPCPAPASSTKKGITYTFGCPYKTYKPFFDYYCSAATTSCHAKGDYVNQIVVAATTAAKTTFTNFDMDFTATSAFHGGTTGPTGPAKAQVIKKGSKFLGAMMYAIREFEDAIDDCTGGTLTANELSSGSVHAWDEGVAFYVGSKMDLDMLSGAYNSDGTGTYTMSKLSSQGCLSYSLGNKRCKNFKTCGPSGTAAIGEAKANSDLWPLFNQGQQEILVGNCGAAVPIKDAIMKKMRIPLIQGTLRYAYKVGVRNEGDEARAEGSIFAAGVLPDVHTCSATHAATIAQHMSLNSATKPDFAAVKTAFEAVYPCLGLKCTDIGGLIQSTPGNPYYTGAEPCVDPPPPSAPGAGTTTVVAGALGKKDKTGETVGIAVGATCGALALIMLLYVCRLVKAEKKGTPIFVPTGNAV